MWSQTEEPAISIWLSCRHLLRHIHHQHQHLSYYRSVTIQTRPLHAHQKKSRVVSQLKRKQPCATRDSLTHHDTASCRQSAELFWNVSGVCANWLFHLEQNTIMMKAEVEQMAPPDNRHRYIAVFGIFWSKARYQMLHRPSKRLTQTTAKCSATKHYCHFPGDLAPLLSLVHPSDSL